MILETETRYQTPSAAVHEKLLKDGTLAALTLSDFRQIKITAEYYDTPAHDLRARGASLRRRIENGASNVSFKVPVQSDKLLVRRKWHCDCDEITLAIGALTDLGAPDFLGELARAKGFVTRGKFDFVRLQAAILLEDGTSAEFNSDVGALTVDTKSEPIREVSFKLLYGDPESLLDLAHEFEKKYDLTREVTGKYEKSLRLLRSR